MDGHELRVHSVPGLATRTDENGGFVVDNLPSDSQRFRLLVPTVPAGFTHRKTIIAPGAEQVIVEVVPAATIRGRVVNGNNRLGQDKIHSDRRRQG